MEEIQELEETREKASRLRILFKIAFICNIFFIVCMFLLFSHIDKYVSQPIIELSLILGWSAMFINLFNFILALILISRIQKRQVPLWLLYTNIILFLGEIFFFFILHD